MSRRDVFPERYLKKIGFKVLVKRHCIGGITKMWYYVICVFIINTIVRVEALWDTETLCPLVCTCQLQHLKETAIHRFMQKQKESHPLSETDFHVNNEVLTEDDLEDDLSDNNPVLRTATCILQTETDPSTLIESLPKNIEALTVIQGAESGNKSLNFTFLQKLPNLLIVELHGSNIKDEKNSSGFFCIIDTPLPKMKYLNFDKITIKVSKRVLDKHEEVAKIDPNPPSVTQRSANKDILPYNKYIQQESNKNGAYFNGFESLVLLRISNCELKNINWEMFDGLQNLEYLILEKNNLKVIPDFAFYGLPNLKSLSLAWNNLLDMQITDLAGLLELEYLDLSHNNFSLLSELSFPPFPKLKLANFANNPINVIFPSTFEVMNTTDSIILGGEDTPLTLLSNSFSGLNMLKKLTLKNLVFPLLKRELLVGMSNLTELTMSGNITKIEFDAFVDVLKLDKLITSQCNLQNISMDAFNELKVLQILDLSHNKLEYLHPGTFDPLKNLKELYLHRNQIATLPENIFSQIHPKLIRLNDNPWHCSCKMSEWKPMIINKVKQKFTKQCDFTDNKSFSCDFDTVFEIKYIFDSKIAPTCDSPKKFRNWNVFHVMRKQLKCANYKPKFKKRPATQARNDSNLDESTPNATTEKNAQTKMQDSEDLYSLKIKKLRQKITAHGQHNFNVMPANNQDMPIKISLFGLNEESDEDNNLNYLHPNPFPSLNMKVHPNEYHKMKTGPHRKIKKQRKLSTKSTPSA